MEIEGTISIIILIGILAALYSSVGHAGASGYLAAMALFGMTPDMMRPAALSLNILVAAIAIYKFSRAGYFSWSLFWKLSVASVPFAYLGGLQTLPDAIYKPLIALFLFYTALRFLLDSIDSESEPCNKPHTPTIMGAGAVLGWFSGLSGVGGGIFLSPLLILLKWEHVKTVSGVASAFILVNSISGLAGVLSNDSYLFPGGMGFWALAAAIGGSIGSEYGSRRLRNPLIKKLLGIVLIIAGFKMVFGV